MSPNSPSIVRQFSNALAQALYDKSLELNGEELKFFFDTDVMINLVVGFEADLPRIKKHLRRERVVRSLLSIGFLGQFHLLRPHAYEFYEKIKNRPQNKTEHQLQTFYRKAISYINGTEIGETLSDLRMILEKTEDKSNHDAKVEKFLDALKKNSTEAFSFIEQINGTWDQRLRRYTDKGLLNLDFPGPETRELMLEYPDVVSSINNAIWPERPNQTLNVFHDAAALSILHKNIEDYKKGKIKYRVRFYTETKPLIDIFESDNAIKSMLSYDDSTQIDGIACTEMCNIVFRSSDYFIARAQFSELLPNSTDPDLSRVQNISTILAEILKDNVPNLESALSQVQLEDGMSLSDVIRDFEELSLVDALWAKSGIPKILTELTELEQWISIFEFVEDIRTGEILNAKIQDVRNKLEEIIEKSKQFAEYFKAIERARIEKTDCLSKIESPERDLGLVRWGIKLDRAELEYLADTFAQLASQDEEDSLISGEIAARSELAMIDVRECETTCLILWPLGLYEKIVTLIDECKENNAGELPPHVELFRIAALMRQELITSSVTKEELASLTKELIAKAPESQRYLLYLSAGYIYYHLWKYETLNLSREDKKWSKQFESQKAFANLSFEYGEKALKAFTEEENELGRAHALNHCVYVSIVTGVKERKLDEYWPQFIGLEGISTIWAPRFDDTAGYLYLKYVEELWDRGPESLNNEELNRLTDYIRIGQSWFKKARERDICDTDLPEHKGRLDYIEHEIGKLKYLPKS